MPNLFAVYLGGRIAGAHIELHDVRFVIGDRIEDTYEDLKEQWWGDAPVHIDAWMELRYIDGYAISLEKEPPTLEQHLYFINAGGYDPQVFGELHEIGFYVAPTPTLATKKALAVLCEGQDKRHQDDRYDVDDCIELTQIGKWWIHLTPTDQAQEMRPTWYGYGKI